MRVIGITDGPNCGACLFQDGELLALASEERFSRLKNDYGFPFQAVKYCCLVAGIQPEEVDVAVLATINYDFRYAAVKRNTYFSVDDYLFEQKRYWRPKLCEGEDPSYHEIFSDYDRSGEIYYDVSKIVRGENQSENRQYLEVRKKYLRDFFKLDESAVEVVDHHKCHAYYAYFASFKRERSAGILTMDGFGDGKNLSFSLLDDKGKVKSVFDQEQANIGRLYRFITLLLNMKPNEHEYKVMGLAPYANEVFIREVLKEFEEIFGVVKGRFTYRKEIKDHFFYFKEKLEGKRFDAIAGGLQSFVECCGVKLVNDLIERYNFKSLYFSGGVALNIKMNQAIIEQTSLSDFYCPPSGGDESTCVGAAYFYLHERLGLAPEKISSLENPFLGPTCGNDQIESELRNFDLNSFDIERDVQPDRIAQLLVEGKIVSRIADRMEFGARSLGNRSILVDPRNYEVVTQINRKVKRRDFWMPFSPTVLFEDIEKYFSNPKNIYSPHMTIGFNSTALARKQLPAALHPYDKTGRPQILKRDSNPDYYDIIKAFKDKTGVGAVLNTSFNLHGEPIVATPSDAARVFLETEMDALLMNDTLIIRKNSQ